MIQALLSSIYDVYQPYRSKSSTDYKPWDDTEFFKCTPMIYSLPDIKMYDEIIVLNIVFLTSEC